VKVYTYNDKVDIGAWEVTFTLFPGGKPWPIKLLTNPTHVGYIKAPNQ
jgi:hypothetical protein